MDYKSYRHPYSEVAIRTIQITLDDELMTAVDQAVQRLDTSRSAFASEALHDALNKQHITMLERKHRAGYEKFPVTEDEFCI